MDPSSRSPGEPRPWRWVPTLYFCEGIPYVAVMTLSVVMYKSLGISNTAIAFYTSWLNLPWVIKPLWSPLVDLLGTKRRWIVGLQFVLGTALAMIALTLPVAFFFRLTLAVLWLVAFSSATHDIAADGFYLLALPAHEQAAWVGVRSTCYQLAMITGQGGLVFLAGVWADAWGDARHAWIAVFGLLGALMILAAVYHFGALPRPAADPGDGRPRRLAAESLAVFAEFFRKPDLARILAFLLLYRLAQAQLVKLVIPFLLDRRAAGGLGLTIEQEGLLYGTLGVAALIGGGLAGGYVIARRGLKPMLWPMLASMYLPATVFVALAAAQPASLPVIGAALAVEQFGYGFGFTAYMVYMMMVADGPHRTAHYAICTGFMALGMMLPGMPAGWIQDHLGYERFFVWVCVATIPSFIAAALVRIEPGFGRRADSRAAGA